MAASWEGESRRPGWPEAAIFDCDGLLVDTAACWRHAYEVALDGSWDVDIALTKLNGASVTIAAELLSAEVDRRIEVRSIREALLDAAEKLPLAALPGATELVRQLGTRCRLAVATNAPAEVVRQVLARVGMAEDFEAVVASEEVDADKPAPDVYSKACERVGVAPSDAIAFEDSALGAESARRAGLLVIGVPAAGTTLEADMTLRTLADSRLTQLLRLDPITVR